MVKTKRDEILNELTIDYLHEKHKEIVEIIGLDTFVNLAKHFGGTDIYIPKLRNLTKELIYKKIVDEFNGANIKQLAVKYDLTERTIYRIIKDKILRKRDLPCEGQLTLFDIE